MTVFALFPHLLKLCALVFSQNAQHLLAHASHGLTQFCTQSLHAGFRIGGRLTLCAFVQAAHLFALSLGARLETLFDGAHLLALSVRQIELVRESENPAGTSFAHAATPATPTSFLLLAVVVLRSWHRLLRESDGAQGEDKAEAETVDG
jgi:hypothetical protein